MSKILKNSDKVKKIGIIGAGVAGINAAYHLVKKGYIVDIHESRENLGGRINSFIDSKTGDEIDNGQHILIGAYKEFLSLLNGLGTTNLLKYQKSLIVNYYNKNGNYTKLDTSQLFGDLGMLNGLIKFDFLSTKDKINIVLFVFKMKLGLIKLNNISILDLLNKQSQSKNAINCFWEPMILATMNTQIDICDANLFLNVLKQGFFAGSENSKIIIPKVGLCNLINPIQEIITNSGGNVFFRSIINEIEIIDEKVIITNSEMNKYEYDEIIIAITPDRISKIKGLNINWVNNFEFSPIISIYLWFEREFFDKDFAAIIDTKVQWIFNKRKISGIEHENSLVSLTISAADDLIEKGNKEIADICESELRNVFPLLENNNLLHYRIIKERNATLKVKTGIDNFRKKVDSICKVHFAGCWTNTGLPSTIEGAAISGKLAADKIIN